MAASLTVQHRLKAADRATGTARLRGGNVRFPAAIRLCALALVGAFFLRSSSLPTGLHPNHLFLACCGTLVLTLVYLLATHRLTMSVPTLALVALTLPSLLAAEDGRTSALKWFGWMCLICTVGPMFSDEIKLKVRTLHWTRRCILFCTLGSLLLNLAGIRLSGRGVYFGLMGHTMLLAPVAALAAIDLFTSRERYSQRVYAVLMVLCTVTCIGAGSRGAVVGMTAGILTHVTHRKQGFMVLLLAALGLAGASLIQLNQVTNDRGVTVGGGGFFAELAKKGTSDTRGHLWAARIREYTASPVVGVGFQQQRIYREDTDEKFLEPGSSYLAVLSMTGTLGTVGFLAMMASIWSSLFGPSSCVPGELKDVLRGWMAFFSVHFLIEGYVFACGSLLCFLFWLTAGCALSLHHQGLRRNARLRVQQLSQRRGKMAA